MPQLPYFGRAWRVTIDTADGKHYVVRSLVSDQRAPGSSPLNADREEPLRVTFAIDTYALLSYWTAEITIHNLSPVTAAAFHGSNLDQYMLSNVPLQLGDQVTLSAGYQNSQAGAFDADSTIIWQGPILQPMRLRRNVVDEQLVLRCMLGLWQDMVNHTSQSISKGVSAYDTIMQVCSDAEIPINRIDDAAKQSLQATVYPRAQGLWGKPFTLIRQIAQQHLLVAWCGPQGLNLRSFSTPDQFAAPEYAYGPPNLPGPYTTGGTQSGIVKKTLIGTPTQTQDGIIFQVLLDSDLQIGNTVQLAPGTSINPYPIQFGQRPPWPNVAGIYVVVGLRHFGDSRGEGDSWFTEVVAQTPGFFADFLTGQRPAGN